MNMEGLTGRELFDFEKYINELSIKANDIQWKAIKATLFQKDVNRLKKKYCGGN